MSRQVELQVRLELLSDTIFGSGHSIPGGEDIAVCQDENGYPYLKGTTFKGLLRESMHDLLEWSGGPTDTVEALLGKEGWTGTAGGRRLHLTPLTLEEKPEESETCYDHRTFTSLENDVVKRVHYVRRCVFAEDRNLSARFSVRSRMCRSCGSPRSASSGLARCGAVASAM